MSLLTNKITWISNSEYLQYANAFSACRWQYSGQTDFAYASGVSASVYIPYMGENVFAFSEASPFKLLAWHYLGLLKNAYIVDNAPFGYCRMLGVVRRLRSPKKDRIKRLTARSDRRVFDPDRPIFWTYIAKQMPRFKQFWYNAERYNSKYGLTLDWHNKNYLWNIHGNVCYPVDIFYESCSPKDYADKGAKAFFQQWR